ncbi:MAG: radical SAM protein [Bacillota bacterium]
MPLDVSQHPCFNPNVRSHCARVHLPVAEKCNIQCHFCNRKYDCMNESRPGVTSAILAPTQAIRYLHKVMAREARVSVAGVAGPGDPFAEPERTMETLRRVREDYPEMLLCVASNGLNIGPYVEELAKLQVSHVTITVNAVDPQIGANIYAWVRDGRTIYRGIDAARLLLQRQVDAIRGLKAHGITVKINAIIIPGINDEHILDVAKEVAELGADLLNCMPLYPTRDTVFENVEQPSPHRIDEIRRGAAIFLPQMSHCTRCRSDAVGLLGRDHSARFAPCLEACANSSDVPIEHRPYVAVASWEGMLVNQHLGEASNLWIFKETPDGFEHLELRETPAAGLGGQRWLELAELLKDCRAILVSGIGPTPRSILAVKGIRVVEMEGVIEEGLQTIYRGGDLNGLRKRQSRGCGEGCTGTGGGCG